MSLWSAIAVIAGAVALMVAIMLLVRARWAPQGGHFHDSDRASGVFTFVGAGFAIMLGFVVLLTFEGYSDAKSHAEDEATAVFDQYEVAALFQPAARRNAFWGSLVCYARAVVEDEWPAMEHGGSSRLVDHWIENLETQVPGAEIATNAESIAYQQWFEKAAERDNARRQRLLEARGTLPILLWVMLFIGAVTVVGFVLFFADPGERALGQGLFMGGVTAVAVTTLLAVSLLAAPFQGASGSVKPVGMRYTLKLIEEEAALLHDPLAVPCDAGGRPA